MKTSLLRTIILGSAMFIAMHEAGATVIFQTGNQQYTNVNIAADVNALSIVGSIGGTGLQMTFENMIGPDGKTQVEMHGQHGVAFVESYSDSQSSAQNHTGFSSITLMAQTGYGFTAGDFALDELNSGANPGTVTFNGIDQFGNPNTATFSMGNGQNQYNFYTQNGEIVTSLVITAPTTSLLQDIKQVSVNAAAIPEPSTLASAGIGLAALGWFRRRETSGSVQSRYPVAV